VAKAVVGRRSAEIEVRTEAWMTANMMGLETPVAAGVMARMVMQRWVFDSRMLLVVKSDYEKSRIQFKSKRTKAYSRCCNWHIVH
jgi:3-hydroxyisobutyrate dehydrogenase-like beta-hydroxyacid dehydrogenase